MFPSLHPPGLALPPVVSLPVRKAASPGAVPSRSFGSPENQFEYSPFTGLPVVPFASQNGTPKSGPLSHFHLPSVSASEAPIQT